MITTPQAEQITLPPSGPENNYVHSPIIHQNQFYEPLNQFFTTPNQLYSPQDHLYSPQNQFYWPQDRLYSPQDRLYSPQDRLYSPQDHLYSPQDHLYSPQNQPVFQPLVLQPFPTASNQIANPLETRSFDRQMTFHPIPPPPSRFPCDSPCKPRCIIISIVIFVIIIAVLILLIALPVTLIPPSIPCGKQSASGVSCPSRLKTNTEIIKLNIPGRTQYIFYSYTYTAKSSNEIITFAFDKGWNMHLDDVSIVDIVTETELIIDGGFESGTLNAFCVCDSDFDPTKVGFPGHDGGSECAVNNFFSSVKLSQVVNTKASNVYNVSFWLSGETGFGNQVSVYMSEATPVTEFSARLVLLTNICILFFIKIF